MKWGRRHRDTKRYSSSCTSTSVAQLGTVLSTQLSQAGEKAKQNNNNKQNQLANDTAHLRQQEQNQLLQPREIFLSFDVASS